jgi:hypothetical protein
MKCGYCLEAHTGIEANEQGEVTCPSTGQKAVAEEGRGLTLNSKFMYFRIGDAGRWKKDE